MKKIALLSVKDLANKKPAELEKYIEGVKAAQREFAHQISLNKEKSTHKLGQYRKAVARAKTFLTAAKQEEK